MLLVHHTYSWCTTHALGTPRINGRSEYFLKDFTLRAAPIGAEENQEVLVSASISNGRKYFSKDLRVGLLCTGLLCTYPYIRMDKNHLWQKKAGKQI